MMTEIDPTSTNPMERLQWVYDRVNAAMEAEALRMENIRIEERATGLYDIIEEESYRQYSTVAFSLSEGEAMSWMVGYFLAWKAHTDKALLELKSWDE